MYTYILQNKTLCLPTPYSIESKSNYIVNTEFTKYIV